MHSYSVTSAVVYLCLQSFTEQRPLGLLVQLLTFEEILIALHTFTLHFFRQNQNFCSFSTELCNAMSISSFQHGHSMFSLPRWLFWLGGRLFDARMSLLLCDHNQHSHSEDELPSLGWKPIKTGESSNRLRC